MSKADGNIFKYKNYVHFDTRKNVKYYKHKIKDVNWLSKHGFYPFIHFEIKFNKYVYNEGKGKYSREKKPKIRDIYYSSHIDRYIYQYYANELNKRYNDIAKKTGINKVSIAYRNQFKGKCNIDFAKEVIEFICKQEKAFIYVADFTKFFDGLDHNYLKSKICTILGSSEKLPLEHYVIFKNITNFTYVEKDDILTHKEITVDELKKLDKIFETSKSFQEFKKNGYLKKHKDSENGKNKKGIPQGSSISAVYSNIYMIDFDRKINQYVTSQNGMYRRYCDDIIIIIPNKSIEEMYSNHLNFIDRVKTSIPNLEINDDKTSKFIYSNGVITGIENTTQDKVDYLGFTFDGKSVSLREKSLFKYYTRMYQKVRVVNKYSQKYSRKVFRKRLYKLYSHLGANRKKGYGNFLTYSYRAHDIFNKDNKLYKVNIRNQVKNHWIYMNKALISHDKIVKNKKLDDA